MNCGIRHMEDNAASPTFAFECAVSVFDGLSISAITTVTAYEPSSAYMWVPLTVNGPPVGPVITPTVVGVLSPQSIDAKYSVASEAGSGSLNVATGPLYVTPSVGVNVIPCAVIGGSATTTVTF